MGRRGGEGPLARGMCDGANRRPVAAREPLPRQARAFSGSEPCRAELAQPCVRAGPGEVRLPRGDFHISCVPRYQKTIRTRPPRRLASRRDVGSRWRRRASSLWLRGHWQGPWRLQAEREPKHGCVVAPVLAVILREVRKSPAQNATVSVSTKETAMVSFQPVNEAVMEQRRWLPRQRRHGGVLDPCRLAVQPSGALRECCCGETRLALNP